MILEGGHPPENRKISQQPKKVQLYRLTREITAIAKDGVCIVIIYILLFKQQL